MMPRISIPALILAITAFPVSADDMMTGLAAYDAGDYRVAVAHWRAASEAGEIAAMTSLADLYMQGLGVPRDIDKGVYWYRVAAERGDAIVQLNLGELLGEGTVVPRNRIQAFQWLGLAARQGNAWARNRLRPLAARMSADAIKEAKARIAAWAKDDGLRIDHLLLSPQAADRLKACGIDKTPRGKEKPSDHTPVWCELTD